MKYEQHLAADAATRALGRSLLDSARLDGPPPATLAKTAAVLGVSAAALAHASQALAGASATTLGGASAATTQAGAHATARAMGTAVSTTGGAGLTALKGLLWLKWAAGGLLLGAVTTTAVEWVMHGPAPESKPETSRALPHPEGARPPLPMGSPSGPGPLEPDPPSDPYEPEALATAAVDRPVNGAELTLENPPRPRATDGMPVSSASVPAASFPSSSMASPAMPSTAEPQPPGTVLPRAGKDLLAGEVRRLDSARAELASGQVHSALVTLGRYHSEYPQGVLRAEALALTVDAWRQAGAPAEAERWLELLRQSFPRSHHLERLKASPSASPR